MKSTHALRLCMIAIMTIAMTGSASAADEPGYPKKRITLIVPFPPGGMTDILARRTAKDMEESFKQPVIVENRPGASGQIGTQQVARSPADGYTLLVSATHHVINPAIKPSLPYDASRDFTPIALLATTPNVLVVHPSIPVSNLQEYLAYAKKKDGLSFGSSSIGGSTHLSGELLKLLAKAPLVHVPYKGATPAMTDLLGGQIPSLFHDATTMVPYVQDGRVKAIGVTSSQRSPALPNVPTIAEQGVPGYEATTWIGFYGPANLPKPIVDKLNKAAVQSMNSPEATEMLSKSGTSPGKKTPSEFSEFVQAELSKWKRVAQEAGIKTED